MGVFKNEVGRPSNDVIKKRNILKFICFILVVIILLLVAYIVNDKLNIVDVKKEDNKVTTKKAEEISNEEAKNILRRVFGKKVNYTLFENYKSDDIDAARIYYAILQSNEEESNEYNGASCIDLFGNDLKDIRDGMIYSKGNATFDNFFGDDFYLCDNYSSNDYLRKVYTYVEANKTYKYLYGNDLDIPKKNTQFSFQPPILYSSIKNAYTYGAGSDRGFSDSIYGINSVIKADNEITINVSYGTFICGEREEDNNNWYCTDGEELIVSKDNSINEIKTIDGVVVGYKSNEYEITDKDYLNKLKNNIAFKFFLEDGVWKLKDIISE